MNLTDSILQVMYSGDIMAKRAKELTVNRFVRTARGIIPIEEITPEEREIWQNGMRERLRKTFSEIFQDNKEFLDYCIKNGDFIVTK